MSRPSSSPNFTTDRPVAVLMVFLAAVVYGYFSFMRLPVTLMPPLNYPTLTVRTEYPGAAPEEVENEVSRPVEEALGVVAGLNRISSVSRAGISDVVLEFVWGTDMSEAIQNTLEKLDLVFLPDEAERPLLLQFDPSLDPIMELSFSGEGTRYEGEQGLRRLRRLADLRIKRALEPIKGVAAVRVRGGLEEEIHILLDEQKLLRSGLSIQDIIDRARQENINLAGGTIEEGPSEFMIRTLNEYENLEQIEETVVRRINEREIRIKDLGHVEWAHKEREIITKTDGAESVQIDIYKEADANIVAVAQSVRDILGTGVKTDGSRPSGPARRMSGRRGGPGFMGGEQPSLAGMLKREEGGILKVVADRSRFIENSINEVRNTAILGGLLAVAVLFLFLHNGRTTLIIAVSIPMSLLITFAPLHLSGVSLNIMSLGGLALGVGMLVDSSIVVLESIFRCREEGDDLRTAAIRGTTEVRAAVAASTFTSIAVFFPMVFVEGIAGQVFGDLGIAVVVSLLASLIVALYFIPMLASRTGLERRASDEAPSQLWRHWASWQQLRRDLAGERRALRLLAMPYFLVRFVVAAVLETIGKCLLLVGLTLGFIVLRVLAPVFGWMGRHLVRLPVLGMKHLLEWTNRAYPALLRRALRHPWAVVALALLSLAVTVAVGSRLSTELLPEVHQGEFSFEVQLPVGTPLETTSATMEAVEAAILRSREDIDSVLVTFGYDVTNIRRSDEGEHSARFKILLHPTRNPQRTEERVLERLRAFFGEVPDLEIRLQRPVLFSERTPLVVELQGDDLRLLKRTSDHAVAMLEQLSELADVDPTLKRGAPEVQISYDRDRLMRYGLNLNQVARLVRDMVKGFEATRFNLKDRRVPILVRLEEQDREYINDVGRLTVNTGGEHPIPLNAIAELKVGEGPSEVRRVDGRRVALIEANLAQGSLGAAAGAIDETLSRDRAWPVDVDYRITGQSEEWERSKNTLLLALGLSVFLVYVIMAAQFESLLQPLIIMVSVPLAFLGTALGLWLLDISISVVVFLGMIMLIGIVVNNAIVLLDYINKLRARGHALEDAVALAGQVRLRPILMTTATTVLGLLPMALGLGEGAEIRTPMAVAVICGLITSTALTLVIVPTLYSMIESLLDRLYVRRRGDPAAAHRTDPTDPTDRSDQPHPTPS